MDDSDDVDDLRARSEWLYLKKREDSQQKLFKRKLEREAEAFRNSEISHAECKRALLKEEIIGHFAAAPAETNLSPRDIQFEDLQLQRAGSKPLQENYRPTLSNHDADKINIIIDKLKEIEDTRKSLPVFGFKSEIIDSVKEFQVLILVGETGSGKTTQIPQYIIESGLLHESKKIACTQPRRVAAISVAKRVSEEMQVILGDEVGFSVRFEDCSSKKTRIKYLTDGMMLREFIFDPLFSSYQYVIVDEAHERTLHTDILLGLLRDIIRCREDLKVIISSATLDAKKFSTFFDDAPIFIVPGRRFDVDIYYTSQSQVDYVYSSIRACLQIHATSLEGDILVFLTGQDEIEAAAEALNEYSYLCRDTMEKRMIIAPIYSALPSELQSRIFATTEPNARKIVLATNIAETSITIDGIKYVIDCGYVKVNTYSANTGIESLSLYPCSRASANQRAGRAGRTSAGKCFRLYTHGTYLNEMPENSVPEIQRCNLSSVVLMLKTMGIDDLVKFDFIEPPAPDSLRKSLEELYALGAIGSSGTITSLGRKMAEFPLDPRLARSIVASLEKKCVKDIITIAAMLSSDNNIFYVPKTKVKQVDNAKKSFFHPYGDHFLLLNIWDSFERSGFSRNWCSEYFIQYKTLKNVKDVREQLSKICDRIGFVNCEEIERSDESILECLLEGFSSNVATFSKIRNYFVSPRTSNPLYLHPSSSLRDLDVSVVFFHTIISTSKEYMRHATIVPSTMKKSLHYDLTPKYVKS